MPLSQMESRLTRLNLQSKRSHSATAQLRLLGPPRCRPCRRNSILLNYAHELDHAANRIARLEKSVTEVMAQAPAEMRAVIKPLQALCGVAQMMAVMIVLELGNLG